MLCIKQNQPGVDGPTVNSNYRLMPLKWKLHFLHYKQDLRDEGVPVMIDTTTAVTYINNIGGSHSLICNSLAREIWFWCIDRNLWISAAHLPGTSYVAADKASHVFCDQTEWKLHETIFASITAYFFRPKIELLLPD